MAKDPDIEKLAEQISPELSVGESEHDVINIRADAEALAGALRSRFYLALLDRAQGFAYDKPMTPDDIQKAYRALIHQ